MGIIKDSGTKDTAPAVNEELDENEDSHNGTSPTDNSIRGVPQKVVVGDDFGNGEDEDEDEEDADKEDENESDSEDKRMRNHSAVTATLRAQRVAGKEGKNKTEHSTDDELPSDVEQELQTLITRNQGQQQKLEEESSDNSSQPSEVVPSKDDETEENQSQIAEIRKKEQSIDAMIHQMEMEFGPSPAIAVENSESTGFPSEVEEDKENDESEDAGAETGESEEGDNTSNVSYEQSS